MFRYCMYSMLAVYGSGRTNLAKIITALFTLLLDGCVRLLLVQQSLVMSQKRSPLGALRISLCGEGGKREEMKGASVHKAEGQREAKKNKERKGGHGRY